MDANLVVTYSPAHPGKAEREVRALLGEFGGFEIADASTPGVFLVSVENPQSVVSRLRKLPRDSFETTFKWVPIEKWVRADVGEIGNVLKSYSSRIVEGESWRLVLFKRQYDGHSTPELIQLLTDNIDRENVDLRNADRLVVVEIIGGKAGLSLLKKDEYLDTQKL